MCPRTKVCDSIPGISKNRIGIKIKKETRINNSLRSCGVDQSERNRNSVPVVLKEIPVTLFERNGKTESQDKERTQLEPVIDMIHSLTATDRCHRIDPFLR